MRYSVAGAGKQEVITVGGTNIKELPRTGVMFADLSPTQVARLKSDGATVNKVGKTKAGISPPVQVSSVPSYTPTQLAELIGVMDVQGLTIPPLYGQSIFVAVLDTGIRESHEQMGGMIVYSKNFTDDKMEDGYDHGTGVASVIRAVAPYAGILNMKVLDRKGSGSDEWVVDAIEECMALREISPPNAPWIINLSIGSEDSGDPNDVLRIASRAAVAQGIWVIAAAGNEGPLPETVMSPACDPNVVAVGSLSVDPYGVSDFSSRGPTEEGLIKPDLMMFGENVIAASSKDDRAVAAKSGTSFAAPFVSTMLGLCAEGAVVYKNLRVPSPINAMLDGSNGYEQVTDISKYLEGAANLLCVKPEGMNGNHKDNNYGYGMLSGTLTAQSLGAKQSNKTGISGISSAVSGLVSVGMFSTMMKAMFIKGA